MTEQYETIVRGGTVVTAADICRADIGIRGDKIAAVGVDLGSAAHEIDARGKLVMPGGVDTHAHIEQVSASGLFNADDWQSATTSAALGGTTTVITFAAQHVGLDLMKVVDDYSALAARGSIIDYSFHLIVADPTEATLKVDLPALAERGLTSVKLFTTYDKLILDDEQVLDVLQVARDSGAFACIHAENHGVIKWMTKRLLAAGNHALRYHAEAHARIAEVEAINRIVRLAELVDQPVMIFHVSTAEGVAIVRDARARGLPIYAETCPQYLFLTAADLDRPGSEAAKWMCSPPPRNESDQEALWRGLESNDLQCISSDHAPYAYDETGKLHKGRQPRFDQVPSGLPGIGLRMPLLFDAMVSKSRLGPRKFVELTATRPARLYGLEGKGSLAPGLDADIVVWDPHRKVRIADDTARDRTGYTPYQGRTVEGWPVDVLIRGRTVVAEGKVLAEPGSGQFLPRKTIRRP